MKVIVHSGYDTIDAAAWDRVVGPGGSPFLEHVFLSGLERLGCAAPETGWGARPVTVHDDDGLLVAAAPAWITAHSMGEFVYDHAWADAAHRAGFEYYPKLVVGVPFTPVTGQRLLVGPDAADPQAVRRSLLQGVQAAAKGCHGIHVLFDTEDEAAWLARQGMFERLQFQFHWYNHGYDSFEGWLSRFPSKKRNKIRRERKDLHGVEIEAVVNPSMDQLMVMHRFYRNHCQQFGPWGRTYLSKAMFEFLGERWGDRLHLVLARDSGRLVAGAFNVVKGDRLYGRYWGAESEVPFLHFEVCYYRAIEECIRLGLSVFEPGHGGGHKYRRGFEPTITRSSHRLLDDRLHDGLARYASQEASEVQRQVVDLREQLPYKPPST